jgi:hypothetical protein
VPSLIVRCGRAVLRHLSEGLYWLGTTHCAPTPGPLGTEFTPPAGHPEHPAIDVPLNNAEQELWAQLADLAVD